MTIRTYTRDNEITIKVPLDRPTIMCRVYAQEGKRREFLVLKDIAEHLREQHNNINVWWACLKCDKKFERLHATCCHHAKCKGTTPAVKRFLCEACAESFDTKIGRSQHERHRHPLLRNRKRREAAENPGGQPGRKPSVWTEEETALLIRLNDKFKDERFINVKIAEFMPNKTRKQISDKRLHLQSYQKRKAEEEQEKEATRDQLQQPQATKDVQQANKSIQTTTADIIVISNDEEMRENIPETTEEPAWKEAIRQVIQKTTQDVGNFKDMHTRLARLAQGDTREDIDTLTDDLVSLMVSKDEPREKQKRHPEKKN